MSKHTPGPWHVGMRSGANSNMIYAYEGKNAFDDPTICSVYRMYQNCDLEEQKDPIGIANAKLIAAAPDLLEALQSFVFEFGDKSDSATVKKARAAIKKATE